MTAGIRPEHLELDDDGPIEVVVGLAEPLGANTLLHGTLKDSALALVASLGGIHELPRAGQTLKFSVDAEDVHLFDRDSGLRIG